MMHFAPGTLGDGRARMMVARAFLSSNVALGCAFGGLGISVLSLQDRFGTSRGLAAMGMALTVLTLSAFSPVTGSLIVRIGLRKTMISGAALSALGYMVLALAPSMPVALAACGLLIGPGVAMLGTFPASILAGGWFPQARGRAVGLANIPLFLILIPLFGMNVIQRFGLPTFFFVLAALHISILPLLLGVADPPVNADPVLGQGPHTAGNRHPLQAILSRPLFWALVIGDGAFNAISIAGAAHIVPIAVEYGVSREGAGLLLSVMGVGNIPGSILSGFLCDRFGPTRTLTLTGLGFATSWAIIAATAWLPAVMAAMLLMGICGASILAPINVLVAKAFGLSALPRVLGLIAASGLPFTFFMPPAAGWLHDRMGDYNLVIAGLITASLIVAAVFFHIDLTLRRRTVHSD